ncbi:MAG: hypothetical protein ACXV2J_12695 [Actinomycetes bacterium]
MTMLGARLAGLAPARWRALESDHASRAIGRGLGFVDYGGNWAARPATGRG